MTGAAAVSIVVVSRPDRARLLRRCLIALSQLRYDTFEIVVVADAGARMMLRELPQAVHAKVVPFDETNLSAARNMGIAHADGEIIAFTEDDAVPEPSWLTHLSAPFDVDDVGAVAGVVYGPDGFSLRYQAETVDKTGQIRRLSVDAAQPTLLTASPGQGVRTHSASLAVRRDLLEQMGGLDPGFRQDLGILDLNMRMARHGVTTAVVPKAVVYQGLGTDIQADGSGAVDTLPSDRDTHEAGAAWALFLRRHCEPGRHPAVWRRLVRGERRRLVRHMITGRQEPRDVRRNLRALQAGYQKGAEQRQTLLRPMRRLGGGFRPFPSNRVASIVLSGRTGQLRRLRQTAVQEIAAGRIVTVLTLSWTMRRHRIAYSESGFWEQSGGLFGRSGRLGGRVGFWSFRARIAREKSRIAELRLTAQ